MMLATEGSATLHANEAGCKLLSLLPSRDMLLIYYISVSAERDRVTVLKSWKLISPVSGHLDREDCVVPSEPDPRALSPGIYCTVELKIPRKTPWLIVPSEAIVFNGDGLSVAVVEGGIARIRPVTVARDFDKTVKVSAGVKDGDRVILNLPVDLVDCRKIQVRPAPLARLS
jgi:hypothetical protein